MARLLSWRTRWLLARRIEIAQRVRRRRRLRELPVGVSLGVERSIANRFAFAVDPGERLLEQNRLGASGRHRGLMNVEPAGVLVDRDVRARAIGIRELDEPARHHVEEVRAVVRDLDAVALQ